MSEAKLKVGCRVKVTGKDDVGTIAFVGTTHFQQGKWIGVVLDEPKGKNNGSVQGKSYFNCEENFGLFVRATQIQLLNDDGNIMSDSTQSLEDSDNSTADLSLSAESKKQASDAKKASGLKPPSAVKSKLAVLKKSADSQQTKPGATPSKLPAVQKPLSQSRSGSKQELSDVKIEKKLPTEEKLSTGNVNVSSTEKAEIQPEISNNSKQENSNMQINVVEETAVVPEKILSPVSHVAAAHVSGQATAEISPDEEALRNELADLKEKYETIKIKRSQDVAKLKELDKIKIQLQQLQEYKQKMQESQADLQRQLQASKKEAGDLKDEYERYKEEMSESQDMVDMATVDKEVAEERADLLQQEMDQMKEKIEELTLDLQIAKEELTNAETADGGMNSYQVKQLEVQNERLKEAIVKMKELANYEKQENGRLQKDIEGFRSASSSLAKDKEKLEKDCQKMMEEIIELKEQVDLSLGAEEMVEKLTEKILNYEEQIVTLQEEKNDLEALCDMNDEIHETARESELELRESLDISTARCSELNRKLNSTKETMSDYQDTINKFRELVASLQTQIKVPDESANNNNEARTTMAPIIEFDFKTKFAETKAAAKAIDLELRKLDVGLANQHVGLLCSFMPENFMKRGGDHDVILVLLLIPRLHAKCELLFNTVIEKFEIPEEISREDVIKNNKSEGFAFAYHFAFQLSLLQKLLKLFENSLNICNEDTLLKMGTLFSEILVYEKNIDLYIDLLRKDQMDESTSIEPLEKAIIYFEQLYNVHLSSHKPNHNQLMNNYVQSLVTLANLISTDATALKLALIPGQDMADMSLFLKDFTEHNNEFKSISKKMRRRILNNTNDKTPLNFSKEIQNQLDESLLTLGKVAQTTRLITSATSQLLAIIIGPQQASNVEPEKQGISADQMEEVAIKATARIYGLADSKRFPSLMQKFVDSIGVINKIATNLERGEFDFDGTSERKVTAPVILRASQMRSEFAELDNMKHQIELKDVTILELKKNLKSKQDDHGEVQARMQILEKKYESISKDAEAKVDKVMVKLDEANLALKKKEKSTDCDSALIPLHCVHG